MGSASRGQSATAKVDYISREGKYGRDAEEVEHIEHGHMPGWAADNARGYWQAADGGERANGRLYVEVQVALPVELDRDQQRELAQSFAGQLTEGESLPYTLAIHRGESQEKDKPDNPHAHIVLSERSNDGVARTAETWFRRANRQEPERGGAAKVSHLQAREWPQRIRQGWASECNRALERAGREERIDPRTLAEQAREAYENGDLEQAAELSRPPEPKRGAGDAIQQRYEQGQAAEPSRAVAAWERVRAENERWRKECRKRSQKADRARAALDAAARLVPASEEERAVGQVVGKAIGKRRAQAARRSGEEQQRPRVRKPVRGKVEDSKPRHVEGRRGRPTKARKPVSHEWPSGKLPAHRRADPTPWERYQKRWPEHAAADREPFEAISKMSEVAKNHLRYQWRERFMRIVSTAAEPGKGEPFNWERTEPLPLPRALAPPGKAEYGAAQSERAYHKALPLRYGKRWMEAGISRRVEEVAEKARTSLRGRLSRNPEKYVEDVVRRECGPQAQRLDQEMREDMRKKPPHRLAVLNRMDTMQYEEREAAQERQRVARERVAREYLERMPTREPKIKQGPELSR